MKHPWNLQSFENGASKAGRSQETIKNACAVAAQIKSRHPDLPVIWTLRHPAHLTDTSYRKLREFVSRQSDPYRVFRLKKRSHPGGSAHSRRYRTICIPEPALLQVQRWLANEVLHCGSVHDACFSYVPRRNIQQAAERHCNCQWLVKIDVQRFFESISEQQVFYVYQDLGYPDLLAFEIARLCTRLDPKSRARNGRWLNSNLRGVESLKARELGWLPQGAPTSPSLANLVVRPLDKRLDMIARNSGWVYTRYADDLAFSTKVKSTREQAVRLVFQAKAALRAFGLEPNREKTKIAPPGARKVLLGLLVDGEHPRLSHQFRNNLETHIYAIEHPKIGPSAHRVRRGFASTIGMRRHIEGLINFAYQIEPQYACLLKEKVRKVLWE